MPLRSPGETSTNVEAQGPAVPESHCPGCSPDEVRRGFADLAPPKPSPVRAPPLAPTQRRSITLSPIDASLPESRSTTSSPFFARPSTDIAICAHHPAGLNFGDCFPYALAKTEGQPLLFKGMDFPTTDVGVAAE